MSHPQTIHFSQLNQKINFPQNSNKDLIEFLDISKGKILTLLKTVFSFLNDKSLLKKEPQSSFIKYTIDSKLIQTMSKVNDFYTSNFPENGRDMLHELVKEKYNKLIKYYEQNNELFISSKESEFKYYAIKGLILLWLIEIKYDTEYYDEFICVINSLIRLSPTCEKNEKNKFLSDFLNIIIKFPYIKQNKEVIVHALEVNECTQSIIDFFSDNLKNLIKDKNSIFRPDDKNAEKKLNSDINNNSINIGKKSIESQKEESYFSLIKENKEKKGANTSISHKRNSFNNISYHKSMLSTINSSGFYTPEFKHNNKRESLRHYRRFTINNINNPKISISIKNGSFSRSISQGMNNLLSKCEQGNNKNINNNKDSNNNANTGQSTKSKIRLAVQGHFYTDDDFKNNIDIKTEENKSLSQLNNNEINNIKNNIEIINTDCEDNNNINNNIDNEREICHNDDEDEIENNIVSVDELPINPNLSIISNSNSKNIGIEPENIIQETKEEEENDENDIICENGNINSNNTYVKILTDNEIQDFFDKQFSDKKNKNSEINNNKLTINNHLLNDKNKDNKKNKNKKRNNSTNSINNMINNNKSKKNENLAGNKENNKSKKNVKKSKSKDKENNIKSSRDKMKNYNQNIFGMIKNHKNKTKDNVIKNKNDNNCILEPCTKGKEMMNNTLKNVGSKKIISKEKLPTDSVAKKNLYSLYNQMKTKK